MSFSSIYFFKQLLCSLAETNTFPEGMKMIGCFLVESFPASQFKWVRDALGRKKTKQGHSGHVHLLAGKIKNCALIAAKRLTLTLYTNNVKVMCVISVCFLQCILWFEKCGCAPQGHHTAETRMHMHTHILVVWFCERAFAAGKQAVRLKMKCLIRTRMGTRRAWAGPGPLLTCPSRGEAHKQGHDGRKAIGELGRRWRDMGR